MTLMFNLHHLEDFINSIEKSPPFPEMVRNVSREIDSMREEIERDLLHHLDQPAESPEGRKSSSCLEDG